MSVVPPALRPVRGFLRWWARSLLAWLPAGWRRHLFGGERLLLAPDGAHVRLLHEQPDGQRELARLPAPLPTDGGDPLARLLRPTATRLARWLLLPPQAGLRRRLALPAAAGPRLREVLGFEIERQTPFAAQDVAYDARLLAAQADDGGVLAELVVAPQARIDAVRASLGAAGDALAGIDLADAAGTALGVNLLGPGQRVVARHPNRRRNLLLALATVVLATLALAGVLDNRRAAADALQVQVDARASQARAVAARRQALLDGIEGTHWLQQQRAARAPAVEVLNALAVGLPDGTYVDKVAIEGGRLTVIGLSNQVASLVGRLQGAQQPWRNAALSGAVQPDPVTRRDRFTLVAELATAAPPQQPVRAAQEGAADGAR